MSARPADSPSIPSAARLEKVREKHGVPTVRDFIDRLNEADGDFQVKYDTARRYHRDREASADYYARVARVFGVSLEWLITGDREMDEEEELVRDVEEAAARLEDYLTDNLFAGFRDGFGEGADRVLRGTRRALLIHTWRRCSGSLGVSDVELGRALGRTFGKPFESLELDPANLPGDDLTDFTQAICAAFNRLTAITHVEDTDAS